MRLNREEFLRRLEQVSPGVATREVIEQSASFIFKDGKIITFNDEIACLVNGYEGITGAVHAEPLMALLSKLSEDEVEVECVEGEFIVKGKNKRSGIRMEKEILLPIATVEDPTGWKELDGEFGDAIEVVQSCASKDDTSFNLTCIHITDSCVEACDNFQMVRYPIKTGLEDCLIRRDAIKHIFGLGMTQVSQTPAWVHFKSPSGITVSCRRWNETYGDLSPFFAFEGSKVVLPGALSEAIEKAEIFSSENAEDNQINVQLKEGRLRLKGEGAHGWYEERKQATYNGPEINFLISPKLLIEITKRTNECEIAVGRLKFNAGKFVFVACLTKV